MNTQLETNTPVLLIDTGIIMDYLTEREDNWRQIEMILDAGVDGYLQNCIMPATVQDIYKKALDTTGDRKRVAYLLEALTSSVHVVDELNGDVYSAVESGIPDYEEALMAQVALRIGADYIITDRENLSRKRMELAADRIRGRGGTFREAPKICSPAEYARETDRYPEEDET